MIDNLKSPKKTSQNEGSIPFQVTEGSQDDLDDRVLSSEEVEKLKAELLEKNKLESSHEKLDKIEKNIDRDIRGWRQTYNTLILMNIIPIILAIRPLFNKHFKPI